MVLPKAEQSEPCTSVPLYNTQAWRMCLAVPPQEQARKPRKNSGALASSTPEASTSSKPRSCSLGVPALTPEEKRTKRIMANREVHLLAAHVIVEACRRSWKAE